jgi:hypothetical protein
MELLLDPANLVFDPEEGLLHFTAIDGRGSLECCISLAALAALAHDSILGRNAIIRALQGRRALIRQIIEHKYRTRQFSGEDKLVIGLEDLP